MSQVIKIENLSKQYRLGIVGTGTISHDLNRWWHSIRGKEDPYIKIGEINDRSIKGVCDYVWALKDINLEVQQGEVLGIIGKNGAGKSTLLKILSKVTSPTTGSISYKGRIASLLEVGTGFNQELTGRENIFLNGAILGMQKREIDGKFDEIVEFSGCDRYIDTPVKRYSSGMMVRLGFAVAAFLEPEILVVDEVLAVGDAEFQKKAIGKMQDVSRNDGRTVLFVSHNMGAIRNLCRSGLVLKNGVLSFYGEVNDAIESYLTYDLESIQSGDSDFCIDKHRVNGCTMDVKILSISLDKEQRNYSTNEDIKLVYVVKGTREVNEFRINATISTIENQPVGSFFGNEMFSIRENQIKKILITIKNHSLTLGKYKISTSVGTGNFIEGMKDFDIVVDVIQFNIIAVNKENLAGYSIWSKSWGDVLFSAICKEID